MSSRALVAAAKAPAALGRLKLLLRAKASPDLVASCSPSDAVPDEPGDLLSNAGLRQTPAIIAIRAGNDAALCALLDGGSFPSATDSRRAGVFEMSPAGVRSRIEEGAGRSRAGTDPADVMRHILDATAAARIEISRPRLEDVFIELVAGGRAATDADRLRAALRDTEADGATA